MSVLSSILANLRRPAAGAILLLAVSGCGRIEAFGGGSPVLTHAEELLAEDVRLKRKPVEAVKEFDKAIAADPNNIDVYLRVIFDLEQAGMPELVAQYGEIANRATSKAPADKRAEMLRHTASAYLHIGNGNTAKAIEFMEPAYKLKPDDPAFMNDLGYTYAEHYTLNMPGTRLQEALRLTQTAVERARSEGAPDNEMGMYVDSLGWVYFKLEVYSKAVANLTRAADLVPGSSEIHVHLAQALHAEDRNEEAVMELQKALKIMPTFTPAADFMKKWSVAPTKQPASPAWPAPPADTTAPTALMRRGGQPHP